MEDYYQVLGVPPHASQEEIKKRFRFLAHAYHPDKFATPTHKKDAEDAFKKINEAYQLLTNPVSRAQYDRQRFASDSTHEEERHRKAEAQAARRRAAAERRRTEEERRRREEAETARRRSQEEQRRREQAEAEQRHAEEERRRQEEAEAVQRRAQVEQQRREQAEAEQRRTEKERLPRFPTDIRDGETVEIVDLHPEDSYYHERRRLIGSLVMVKNPLHRGNGWYCTHAYFHSRHDNELRQGAADGVLFGQVRLKRIARKEKGIL